MNIIKISMNIYTYRYKFYDKNKSSIYILDSKHIKLKMNLYKYLKMKKLKKNLQN